MKRKLIRRNKKKYEVVVKNPFWYRVVKANRSLFDTQRYSNRYISTDDYENAYKFTKSSNRILIPIVINSVVKRSRIKNKVESYLYCKDITEFNKMSGLCKTIDDIPYKHIG